MPALDDRDRYMRTSQAIFLAATEEEYAQTFRDHGWSEHAIEIELETFRAFRAKLPSAKTVEPEPIPAPGDPIAAALAFRRKGRSDE